MRAFHSTAVVRAVCRTVLALVLLGVVPPPAHAGRGRAVPKQIVFVDSSVPDLRTLIPGVSAGGQVVVLDPSSDGVQQIAEALAADGLHDLAAIQIVSHGYPGALQLGSTRLQGANLGSYSEALAAIGASLAPGGDLLLYGCEVAAGVAGKQFIADLSRSAGGIDVAAATHLVGSAALGGNWSLDASTGPIQAGAPFKPETLARFNGLLPVFTNPSGITIPDSASAAQGTISQTLVVSGLAGTMTDVKVIITGLTHTFPDDLDFLLVGPDGTHNLEFWSDAGGSGPPGVSGIGVTVADSGATALPDATGPISGSTHKPADYSIVELSANWVGGPALTINHPTTNGTATFASVFGGLSGNGTWTLWIRDDSGGDVGSLTSWSLDITVPAGNNVGDKVFEDLDGDGIQDAGEPGVDGVTVQLLNSGNTVIDTKTTAGGGAYNFPGVVDGTYSVKFVVPASLHYAFTLQDQGGNDNLDSDANPATGQTAQFTIAGASNTSIDAGLRGTNIGDKVFGDLNNNGIQDAGDTGIDGVTVNLLNSPALTTAATATTAGGGLYTFTNVVPGNYVVQFSGPAGFNFSPKDQGANDSLDTDVNPGTGRTDPFAIALGQTDSSRDAGMIGVGAGPFTFQGSGFAMPDGISAARTFSVGGLPGTIADVKVIFSGLTHGLPDDLDVLLVAPDGTHNLEFWSDIGSVAVSGATVTVADTGASPLPDTGAIVSGTTYRPADYQAVETDASFGASTGGVNHPTTNGSATFATAFSSQSANGTWRLYVADDSPGDIGSVAGWNLVISVTVPPTVSNISKSGNEDTQITFTAANFDAGFSDPNGDVLAIVRVTSLPANGTLQLSGVNVAVNQDIPRANLGNLTFDPAANFSGGTSFGWNGSDGTFFAPSGALVNITVNPINDEPTLNAIADPAAILEGAGQQSVNLAGIGAGGGESQVLTVTALSNNTALIPNPVTVYTSPSATGSLSYTPQPDQFGSAVITVTVTDDGGVVLVGDDNAISRTFTVNVTNVNDAPTLDPIADPPIIAINSPQQTISLTGISEGLNEAAPQTIASVAAVSDNPGLIPNPTVVYTPDNATGSLHYTPVAGQSGTALITVTVTDSGDTLNGGANSFQRQFTVRVFSSPTISKAFAPATIQSGETSTVTLTLSNGNAATALTGAAFTDTLATMSALGGAVTGDCVGTTPNTLAAGATALSFNGITIPAGASCTVIFSVTSSVPGVQPNTTSGVTTTQTPSAGTASNTADLTVLTAPTIAKAFTPTSIQAGGNATVTLTLSNGNTATALTGASFTDTLTNMSAVAGAVTGDCVGTTPNTLSAGATALSFSGITIPANGSCTVVFAVTGSTAGVHPNQTSGVTTTLTPTAGAASNSADLTVTGPPTIAKAFAPDTIQPGGSSTITLTLSNANAGALSGAAFTDTLVNMSAVAGPVTGTCVGTTPNTLAAGETALSFSAITLPANGSCTVIIDVTSGTPGVHPNATSGVTTTQTPVAGAVSNTATLSVFDFPTIAKAFAPAAIQSGATATVTLTLGNTNATALANASFTDTLANMSAAGGPVAGSCLGTTPSSLPAGATALSFGGIALPASGSCTVMFDVTSSTPGAQPNSTSGVTTTQTPSAGTGSNTANLMVVAAPTIAKAFVPTSIPAGGNSTVTLTLSNGNTGLALNGATFTDTLTDMSAVAGAVTGTCVGTTPNALPAGATALSFGGIDIPANGDCTVVFAVTSSTLGVHPNSTSGVTTQQTSTPGSASNTANLTVVAAPTIAKAFAPTTIARGDTATVTVTLGNLNAAALTGAAFSDTLSDMSAAGGAVTGTCVGTTPSSLVAGATNLGFSGITIPNPGCTVTFAVTSDVAGALPNTTSGVTTVELPSPGPPSNTAILTVETCFTGQTATGTGQASACFTGGGPTCNFTNAAWVPLSIVPTPPPAGVAFPHGLFDFDTSGCTPGATLSFTMTLPSPLPAGTSYYKYGPTPAQPSDHWYQLSSVIASGNTITFSVTDGLEGDDDLTVDGNIVDQGGPGVPPGSPVVIPVLDPTGLTALIALLAVAGALILGTKRFGD